MFRTETLHTKAPIYASTFAVEPRKDLVFDVYSKNEQSIDKSILVGQVNGVNLIGKALPSTSSYIVARKVGKDYKLYKSVPILVQPHIPRAETAHLIKKDANARTTLGQVFGTRKRRNIIKYIAFIYVRNKMLNVIHTEGISVSNIDESLKDSIALLPTTEQAHEQNIKNKLIPACFTNSTTVEGIYPLDSIVPHGILKGIDVDSIWKARLIEEVKGLMTNLRYAAI